MTTTSAAFNARAVFTWKSDRQYRIYVQGDQLFFIRTGGQQVGQLVANQFGLIGALIWHLTKKSRERKAEAARQALDSMHPAQLVTQHEHSFQAHVTQLMDQSLQAPSFWQKRGPYAARWMFTVQGGDKMQLELVTHEDVETFLRLVPPLVGGMLRVDAVWNAAKKKYVKRG